MSRRIQTGSKAGTLAPGGQSQDDYLGRLAGYIPTEIVGLYLAASGVIPKANEQEVVLWIVFAACWILTPIYLWYATNDPKKGPLVLQIMLASIAFPVWVFAIGGPFELQSWYKAYIASILLFFVTFIIGFIKPKPGS